MSINMGNAAFILNALLLFIIEKMSHDKTAAAVRPMNKEAFVILSGFSNKELKGKTIMRQSAKKIGIAFIACFLAILLSTTALAENEMTPGQIPPGKGLSGHALSKFIARSNSAEKLPDITNKNLRDKILARTARELLGDKGDAPESGAFFTNAADAEGPWFHGWYTRITDASGASIAVVGATQYLPGTPIPDDFYLPGYLAVIICDYGLIKVYEAFPERTAFWNNRASVLEDPESPYWEKFFWHSKENGFITKETFSEA